MEELIPKVIEFGALAVINILLIFKGVGAMKELSDTVGKLADKVDRMSDYMNSHISMIESRISETEHDLREIRGTLDIIMRRLQYQDTISLKKEEAS